MTDLLLQEGCQGTDKLLLVDVFHCDTRHLHVTQKKHYEQLEKHMQMLVRELITKSHELKVLSWLPDMTI